MVAPRTIHGFTLIELSVVLVIIGLVVGGLLTGRDLIGAAVVRSQIAQIESFQTAVSTFQGKYGSIPGDIPDREASSFGFVARGSYAGQGDGNGFLEGLDSISAGRNDGVWQNCENLVFWRDLSTAKLIPGSFTDANWALLSPSGAGSAGVTESSSPALKNYLPEASYGGGFYVQVASFSPNAIVNSHVPPNAIASNTFVVSSVSTIEYGYRLNASPTMAVKDAFAIDNKVDDGRPRGGTVIVAFNANSYYGSVPAQYSTSDSATTCFNTSTTNGVYSTGYAGGTGRNCALSFRFR